MAVVSETSSAAVDSQSPGVHDYVLWVDSVVEALRPIWTSSKWRNLLEAWKVFETGGHADQVRWVHLTLMC